MFSALGIFQSSHKYKYKGIKSFQVMDDMESVAYVYGLHNINWKRNNVA